MIITVEIPDQEVVAYQRSGMTPNSWPGRLARAIDREFGDEELQLSFGPVLSPQEPVLPFDEVGEELELVA